AADCARNSRTVTGSLTCLEPLRNCASQPPGADLPMSPAQEWWQEARTHTCFHQPAPRDDTASSTDNCARLQSCQPKLPPTRRRETAPAPDNSKTVLVERTALVLRIRTRPPTHISAHAVARSARLQEAPGSNRDWNHSSAHIPDAPC